MMRDAFLNLLWIALASTVVAYAIGFVWIGRPDTRRSAVRKMRPRGPMRPFSDRPPRPTVEEPPSEERLA